MTRQTAKIMAAVALAVGLAAACFPLQDETEETTPDDHTTEPGPGGGSETTPGGELDTSCLEGESDVLWQNTDLCDSGFDADCVIFFHAFRSDGVYWHHTLQNGVSPCSDGRWTCSGSNTVTVTFCDGSSDDLQVQPTGGGLVIDERPYVALEDEPLAEQIEDGFSDCTNADVCVLF